MVTECPFPTNTQLVGKESECYFRDAYQFRCTKTKLKPKQVYHAIFATLPIPVQFAMKLRNTIMSLFGFTASNEQMCVPLEQLIEGKQAGFLTVEMISDQEMICAAYEKNMDMWISVTKVNEMEFRVSTLVNMKTNSGKIYLFVIKPFHRFVAKYAIKMAIAKRC